MVLQKFNDSVYQLKANKYNEEKMLISSLLKPRENITDHPDIVERINRAH